MKIIGFLVVVSLALNVWMISRLDVLENRTTISGQVVTDSFNDPHEHDYTELEAVTSGVEVLKNELASIRDSIADLRVDKVLPDDVSKTEESTRSKFDVYAGTVERLSSAWNHQKLADKQEDWFWNNDSGEEAAISIPDSDTYSVQSVVCRSEWCRAEIEHSGDSLSSEEAELELQLQLSQSEGRDIEMTFGKREGLSQVIFIR